MKKKFLGLFILSQCVAYTGGFAIDIAFAQAEPTSAVVPIAKTQPKATPRLNLTEFVREPAKANVTTEPVAVAATPAPAATPVPPAPVEVPELVGSEGYARSGGNCVNEPGVNNPRTGNPISWAVLSSEPTVGATALFTWNHTGVVTGIWKNGDVEVRHQNYWGGQHRFPRSMFRGFR
ncbi:CHAP domain-containing protein [Patescibacteria group bacterium]|nr:CHAP domain-containing protein [Patescibacteria group bacterium]